MSPRPPLKFQHACAILMRLTEGNPVARGKFPLSVAEKHGLFSQLPVPRAELVRWGDRYREKGLFHDALEFYIRAMESEAIRALGEQAVEQADLVLLLNAYVALGSPAPQDAVKRLHDRALALGKEAVASRAALLLVPSI